MFFNVFYKSEKNMFFNVFYLQINVFNIYGKETAKNCVLFSVGRKLKIDGQLLLSQLPCRITTIKKIKSAINSRYLYNGSSNS